MFGRAPDDIDHGLAIVRGRGDVEKHQLVGFLRVVGHRGFHRIAGIDQIDEVDTFDDAAIGDIKAGDDSFREHAGSKAGEWHQQKA